jgi:hypothetical protein
MKIVFHCTLPKCNWLQGRIESQFSLAGTFPRRRSRLLKTGFFRQVRELKIQRKNPGSALRFAKLEARTERIMSFQRSCTMGTSV